MTEKNEHAASDRLARRIESRWRALGYPTVRCEVLRRTDDGFVSFEVRCNLVAGLPEDFRPEDSHLLTRGQR